MRARVRPTKKKMTGRFWAITSVESALYSSRRCFSEPVVTGFVAKYSPSCVMRRDGLRVFFAVVFITSLYRKILVKELYNGRV